MSHPDSAKCCVSFHRAEHLREALGVQDRNKRAIELKFGVRLEVGQKEIWVKGPSQSVNQAARTLNRLKLQAEDGTLTEDAAHNASVGADTNFAPENEEAAVTFKKPIVPLTAGQARLFDAIRSNTITLVGGPAGTGKTFVQIALAIEALRQRQVDKIVLVRPAIEAGEKLGFLPGELGDKVGPYMRALLDALHEMVPPAVVKDLTERQKIEILSLGYARGLSLKKSFVILDEAQNATAVQTKMFLTRLAQGSKMVISGDPNQCDLPGHVTSGLGDAMYRLAGVPDIAQVVLTEADIVRHDLVQRIVERYEKKRD